MAMGFTNTQRVDWKRNDEAEMGMYIILKETAQYSDGSVGLVAKDQGFFWPAHQVQV